MFDVIGFLETMGADARLRHASAAEVARALAEAGIATPVSSAILAHDADELHALMQLGPLFCVQTAGDEEADPEKRKRKAAEEEEDGNGKIRQSLAMA